MREGREAGCGHRGTKEPYTKKTKEPERTNWLAMAISGWIALQGESEDGAMCLNGVHGYICSTTTMKETRIRVLLPDCPRRMWTISSVTTRHAHSDRHAATPSLPSLSSGHVANAFEGMTEGTSYLMRVLNESGR